MDERELTILIDNIVIPDAESLRPVIHRLLVKLTAERLGYAFPAERLARLSADSMEWMDKGLTYPWAFYQALTDELLLYGDPDAKGSPEPIGILSGRG